MGKSFPTGQRGVEYERSLLRDYTALPPWPAFWFGQRLVAFLDWLKTKLLPPPVLLLSTLPSFTTAPVLYTLSEVGIPEALSQGPQTAAQLAGELGLNADILQRFLRMAVSAGFFDVSTADEPLFRNNAASACLRRSHPNALQDTAYILVEPNFTAFAPKALQWRIKQPGDPEKTCYELMTGEGYWAFLDRTPPVDARFSNSMSQADALSLNAIMEDYDWSRFSCVYDIGGANGSLLVGLLRKFETMTGVLFERRQVAERAAKLWREDPATSALLSRMSFIGGSFFEPETLPIVRDGQAVCLRCILHDWSDGKALEILRNLRKAIGTATATLIISELSKVRPIGRDFGTQAATFDLLMGMLGGGKERTPLELKALLAAAGFEFKAMSLTRSPYVMTEAVPV